MQNIKHVVYQVHNDPLGNIDMFFLLLNNLQKIRYTYYFYIILYLHFPEDNSTFPLYFLFPKGAVLDDVRQDLNRCKNKPSMTE